MKAPYLFIMLSLIMMSNVSKASFNRAESVIRLSKEYKSHEESYTKHGGSFVCSDFQEYGSIDLKPTLSNYKMVAKSVVAICVANPNDGLDPISERLLATVIVTTDPAWKETWKLNAFDIVTPPQPD